jgi:hypothetical protein
VISIPRDDIRVIVYDLVSAVQTLQLYIGVRSIIEMCQREFCGRVVERGGRTIAEGDAGFGAKRHFQ